MFGLPNHHPLSKAVETLARPHTCNSTETTNSGVEQALLLTLEQAVASTSGRGSAAGGTRTGSPVDLGAMVLRDAIAGIIHDNIPSQHDPIARCRPLSRRLITWAETIAGDPTEEDILLMYCETWIHDIRRHLEPPKEVPLRGVPCPRCKVAQVAQEAVDGGTVYVPILTAYASESPLRVECTVCGGEWLGTVQLTEEFGTHSV